MVQSMTGVWREPSILTSARRLLVQSTLPCKEPFVCFNLGQRMSLSKEAVILLYQIQQRSLGFAT